jgi:hypothetical protein
MLGLQKQTPREMFDLMLIFLRILDGLLKSTYKGDLISVPSQLKLLTTSTTISANRSPFSHNSL